MRVRGQDAITAVGELTGVRGVDAHALGGAVFEVDTEDGDLVVAKAHPHPTAVLAEVAGLGWLAEAAAVPVPHVRANDERWLVMEQVEPGSPSPGAAEELGRGLAGLHAAGADAFGAAPGPARAWIGPVPMRNEPGWDWPRWYAAHRVEPYLRMAVDQGAMDPDGAHAVEQVCSRLPELAGPPEPPARLHGDLWNGNVLWARDGRAWLIDPAAHGGHRETDLAMLALFGCPHLERVLAAYDEHAPLAPGWRGRVALHQLFPLLVHVVAFGAGYARQTATAARAALRG